MGIPSPRPTSDARGGKNVTMTFRCANGDTGPVTELRRDDAGNHYILKKQ